MKIACAFDHAGFPLKPVVLETVRGGRARAGRPRHELDRARRLPGRRALRAPTRCSTARAERAVVVCGSGAGRRGRRLQGARASAPRRAHDTYTAHQAVEHDDVNVLCLGARVIGPAYAAEIIAAYARAEFSGEERHLRRLGKIEAIEREFTGGA